MSNALFFDYLITETAQAIPPEVTQLYTSFCTKLRNPDGVVAGLFYGSALWKTPEHDSVWDLYLLVESYRDVSASPLLKIAGILLPPNVYYHELCLAEGGVLRAKIAVMSMAQFTRHCAGRVLAPQTWARFAQPVRIISARDAVAQTSLLTALQNAVITFHRATAPWLMNSMTIEQFWQCGLRQTYASEFRTERSDRQSIVVAASHASFMQRSLFALSQGGIRSLTLRDARIISSLSKPHARVLRNLQRVRNCLSKVHHLLRLIKAVFTFVGGIDYLAYKIERHSGVKLTPGAVARAYPLLGVWPLFLKGLRARAFR